MSGFSSVCTSMHDCNICMLMNTGRQANNCSFRQGFLAGSYGREIRVWRTEMWEEVLTFRGHSGRVESVFLRVYNAKKGSGIVLSASRDKTVKYWDIKG